MSDLQASAEFSTVAAVLGGSFNLSHGITPSRSVLSIAPQERDIATVANLVLRFGSVRMVLVDCLADEASYRYDQSGYVVELSLYDRRWKWRYPTISGHYNVRGPDGQVFKNRENDQAPNKEFAISDSERTPRELMKLCLDAMGEQGYILQDIPSDTRPEVHWEMDNAAQALQSLCDATGCRVVLQLNDRVAIRRVGVGSQVPSGPVMEISHSADPADKPTAIEIHTGGDWFQVDLLLEGVGMDLDGQIKRWDDLSYKPSVDWSDVDPLLMGEITGDQSRPLALKTIYRWFRVKVPLRIPGYDEEIKWLRQLEILPTQVYTHKSLGVVQHRRAVVWGEWYDETGDMSTRDFDPLEDEDTYDIQGQMLDGWTLDSERGIVQFNRPIFSLFADIVVPPKLKLRTAVRIRDAKTGALVRHRKQLDLDPRAGTKPRVIVVPELTMFWADGEPRNRDEIDKELDKHLTAYKAEYTSQEGTDVRYAGWLPISLDGALQSVSWSFGPAGATTTLQRNNDRGSPTTLPYRLRRLHESYAAGLASKTPRDPERKLENHRQTLPPIPEGGFS